MTEQQRQQFAEALRKATLLSEAEWRTIHNALSVYQSTFGSITNTEWAIAQRSKLQQLMDKIRDNFIAKPHDQTNSSHA